MNYFLPEEGFKELEELVSKLNKKHGSSILATVVKTTIAKTKKGVEYPLVEFELSGEKPLLGTHEFLAIKKIDGNHVTLFGHGVNDVPKEYWDVNKTECDHCGTFRARTNLAIIRNIETGEIMQVGKSCLREYTHSMEDEIRKIYNATALYEFITNFVWDDYCPTIGFSAVDIKTYLGICREETQENGFVSVGEAKERGLISTKDICWNKYLNLRGSVEFYEKYRHDKKVEDIISWWLNQKNREEDPFWLNVSSILKDTFVRVSQLGLIAFLPSAYEKHLERMRRLEAVYKFSPYFPTDIKVGDKVEIEVVLRNRSYYETHFSYYGKLNGIYQFSDDDGHCFLWRTGAKSDFDDLDLTKENKILLSGTVKEFSEYKRTKQTVLTRCKFKIL